MPNRTLPLDNDGIYHIYNRAVGNEKLFQTEKQYMHFLKLIEKYLLPKADIWCYCLMPNHFHFLVEIGNNSSGEAVSKAMSDCCNAYTKWLNVISNRKGNLFMRPFKRNKIENDAHLAWTVWYIHRNPLHHKYANSLDEWKFSSYKAIGSPKTKIASKKVLDFFGGLDNFIKFHQIQNNGYYDTLE
jgi:putative transposase